MSPGPTIAPAAAPLGAPAKPDSKAKKASEGVNQGLGADGLVQDATRSASLVAERSGLGAKAIRAIAGVTNGDPDAVDAFVRSTAKRTHVAAVKLAPKAVPAVDREVATVLGAAGRLFCSISKWAQVAALPFVALDIRDAVKEHDPKAKRAAIANAALSVTGGLAGAIGGFIYKTRAGLPLLLVSSVTGAFQLLDHFAWKGRGNAWLGEHVVRPLTGQK